MEDIARSQFQLTFSSVLSRIYGVWWDILNTGIGVFLLVAAFLTIGGLFVTNNLDQLPFADGIDPGKMVEIGLGVIGVTVSGGSIAALALVRVGTQRWSMNRRIAEIHKISGEHLLHALRVGDPQSAEIKAVLSGFIRSIDQVFAEVGGTHKVTQRIFEDLRFHCYRLLESEEMRQDDILEITAEMFAIALINDKSLSTICRDEAVIGGMFDAAHPLTFTVDHPPVRAPASAPAPASERSQPAPRPRHRLRLPEL